MGRGQHTKTAGGVSLAIGLGGSTLFHAAVFLSLGSVAPYEFDFELHLPSEVEFGLTDAVDVAPSEVAAPHPLPATAPLHGGAHQPIEPLPRTVDAPDAGVPSDAGESDSADASVDTDASAPKDVDASVETDASVPDATTQDPETEDATKPNDAAKQDKTNPDAGTQPDNAETKPDASDKPIAKQSDEDANSQKDEAVTSTTAPPTLRGPSRIPAGAQLALRLDMGRIRKSHLSKDVTRFLRAIPDWALIIEGSGIDPINDLDRLMLAGPNLQRAKLVIAGRHRKSKRYTRQRVAAMAKSRGRRASWRRQSGVKVAPWRNVDPTSRVVAALDERHFAITRPKDLSRILAMMKVREKDRADEDELERTEGPDALLSMGPKEALSLEIEGAHRFVRGSVRHLPRRLRLAVIEDRPNHASVRARATYTSHPEAAAAATFWREVRDHYASQMWVNLAGFGKPLRRMQIETHKRALKIQIDLGEEQIRFVLAYLEGALASYRPAGAPAGWRPAKAAPTPPRSRSAPSRKRPATNADSP